MIVQSYPTLSYIGGLCQYHALTDEEYKFNIGEGYVFFEIVEPAELGYTYKINPAAFAPPWVRWQSSTILFCLRSMSYVQL